MKINIVIPSILMGGGLRVIFQYANDWVKRGEDVVVYIPMIFEDVDRKKKLRTSIGNTFKRGTKIDWFPCSFYVKKAVAISDLFIRDADITIAVGPSSARSVSNLNDKKGKKILFVQGHELNEQGTNLEDIDRTYSYENMNIVAITNYMKDYIYKCTGKNAKVIWNGVPEEEYYVGEKKATETKTIIMLANFAHYKGGYEGLNILKKLKEKYAIRCILYGVNDDPNIPEDFEFYKQPPRKQLMKLYTEADICLFPSVEEGWGLVVTEAMANKCAVVGNATGCLREFGKHAFNAMITKPLDYEKMLDYVEQLILDNELLKYIQKNGYDTVKKMNQQKSMNEFYEYLHDLL